MSGYLDRLEQQLVDAARADKPERERRVAQRRTIPVSAAAAVVALLIASAVALAVTGTFSTGSAVRPPGRPVASAGAGIAAPGQLARCRCGSRDPGGRPAVGNAAGCTPRGASCACRWAGSTARSSACSARMEPSTTTDVSTRSRRTWSATTAARRRCSSCLATGQATSQEAGVPQNGVFGARHPELIPRSARRWISYGLLGPGAVSVSYRTEGQERTLPVDQSSGAYLVVLPSPPKGGFEVGGGAFSSNEFVTPQGAISSITYRVHGGSAANRARRAKRRALIRSVPARSSRRCRERPAGCTARSTSASPPAIRRW